MPSVGEGVGLGEGLRDGVALGGTRVNVGRGLGEGDLDGRRVGVFDGVGVSETTARGGGLVVVASPPCPAAARPTMPKPTKATRTTKPATPAAMGPRRRFCDAARRDARGPDGDATVVVAGTAGPSCHVSRVTR
jgi:hypothetical protein